MPSALRQRVLDSLAARSASLGRGLVAGALSVGLLVGCGTDGNRVEVSSETVSSPIASSESTTSGTPNLIPDELYVEAERVYRLYFAELIRVQEMGGADNLPSVMADYLTGEAYASVTQLMRDAKRDGTHYGPGETTRLTASPHRI